jgi:DNA polymerase IV (DinB-like DNA polymerase)
VPGTRLPGVDLGPDDEDRVILHVDMDCFYAACERRRDPDLRGEPVVVGMGYEDGERDGAVATASYEAREFGVESAQAIGAALDCLPRVADADPGEPAGHYRPVDMAFYESVADEVKAAVRTYADTVREVSIDEAYLDATGRTSWERVDGRPLAEGFARHVKRAVAREAGVPASVGVAPNMSAAKVASDHDKPDGLTVVPPCGVADFLAPLSVEAIHGVGPKTAAELREMGVETAGDLASADPAALEQRFGSRGREFHARANGEDDRPVEPRGRPKSLSRESALGPTDDDDEKQNRVRALADDVADRAGARDALYGRVGIKVVRPPYDVRTRARSLPGPVADAGTVREVALSLLSEFDGETVRKLGVRVSDLRFDEGEQASLDGFDDTGAGPERTAGEEREQEQGQASLGEFD